MGALRMVRGDEAAAVFCEWERDVACDRVREVFVHCARAIEF